ncbi:MAG: hypothetical protein WCV93_00500 [Candidatus Shapirobacteria bacterium]|jgi:hypothetical protein
MKEKTGRVEVTNLEDLNEEKVLVEWEAVERSYQERDRDFWVTAIALLVLVSVILFFIKEFFLIIALGSVLFLYYVLSTVPPGKVKNKLTNRGVYFGESRYEWGWLERFWFGKSLSSKMVHFETKLRFPRQISLVINPEDEEEIKAVVVKRIPLLEASPTFVDKVTKWFGERLPLENRNK